MGLCFEETAVCAIESSTMSITGSGTPADPYVISGDSLQSLDEFADLSSPAAMANGTAFFIAEANALVVVKDGKYLIPGNHPYELTGTLSPSNPTANAPVNFVVTDIWPPAPVSISGGDITMDSDFHPAEFVIDSIRPFSKTQAFRPHTIAVTVGGDPNTYELITESSRWEDDADSLTVIPVGRGQSQASSGERLDPYVLSTGALSLLYKTISTGESLVTPSFMTIMLNWNHLL